MLVVEVGELLADGDQPERVVAAAAAELVEPSSGRGALDQLPRLVDDEEAATGPRVFGSVACEMLLARAFDSCLDVLADHE